MRLTCPRPSPPSCRWQVGRKPHPACAPLPPFFCPPDSRAAAVGIVCPRYSFTTPRWQAVFPMCGWQAHRLPSTRASPCPLGGQHPPGSSALILQHYATLAGRATPCGAGMGNCPFCGAARTTDPTAPCRYMSQGAAAKLPQSRTSSCRIRPSDYPAMARGWGAPGVAAPLFMRMLDLCLSALPYPS